MIDVAIGANRRKAADGPSPPALAGQTGGSAAAVANGAADPMNEATATGGNGGAGGDAAAAGNYGEFPAPGAGGGGGIANATATTMLSTVQATSAQANAAGGAGGDAGAVGQTMSGVLNPTGARGGAGGSAKAIASDFNSEGGAAASATAIGGAGGASSGVGNVGGAGGAGQNSTASASGGRVQVSATLDQEGGVGGAGIDGASGGRGGSSLLVNAVSGTTDLGTLTLDQQAVGGNGGDADWGTQPTDAGPVDTGVGGAGGVAMSNLTLNDATAATQSYMVDASVEATGGDGGAGYNGAAGGIAGRATALLTASAIHNLTLSATATGGAGGGIVAGTMPQALSGAAGGQASAAATGHATESVFGDTIGVDAVATGGAGGTGVGAGQAGGAGGGATATAFTSSSGTALVSASATEAGGTGGAGVDGANGGAGGAEDASNIVNGTTVKGTLDLFQAAEGGAGGDSDTGLGGAGGAATSKLVDDDAVKGTKTSTLVASIGATGGNGGNDLDGSAAGGAGGAAVARLTVTGSLFAEGDASAVGGEGGTGAETGAAGSAQATATVTGKTFIASARGITSGGAAATGMAVGSGGSGEIEAAAETTVSTPGPVLETLADAQQSGAGNGQTGVAETSIGGAGFNSVIAPETVGELTGSPAATAVASVLAHAPQLAAAFGAASTVYALGEVGAAHAASGLYAQTSVSRVDLDLDAAQELNPQDLVIGFSAPSQSNGITEVDLTIAVNSVTVVDQSFTSGAAAVASLVDRPIDLGPLESFATAQSSLLDVSVQLTVMSAIPDARLDTGILIGNAPALPVAGLIQAAAALTNLSEHGADRSTPLDTATAVLLPELASAVR